MLMKVPEGRGRYWGAVLGQSERESSLLQYFLSSSAVCLLTVCLALQIGEKTCSPTHLQLQWDTHMWSINLTSWQCQIWSITQKTGCWWAESHVHMNIITQKHVNANCTKMLSKTSMWQGNTHKKSHNRVVPLHLWGENMTMSSWWSSEQHVNLSQSGSLSVYCALFTQHNTPEREQDQDSNQALYLRVYLPLTALTELKVLKRSLHVSLFVCLSSSVHFFTIVCKG